MPQSVRFKALLAKIESTYGTDAAPTTGSDEIQVEENFWTNISVDHLEDNQRTENANVFGRAGGAPVASVGQFAEFEVLVANKGRSAAFSSSNLPEQDVLWRICALEQTVDTTASAETVTYAPRTSGFESATIYAYTGNKEFQLVGCFATARIMMTPGQISFTRYTIRGLVSAINETGIPAGLSFPAASVQPVTVKGAGLTLNAFDPDDFGDFEVDLQVTLAERPGGNATDGHAGYWPTNVDPQITTTYEVGALGTHDPYQLRKDGTEFAWDIGPIGPAQYNRFKLSGPSGRFIGVDHSENDQLAQYSTTIECRTSDPSSSDTISIVYS